MVPNGSSLRYQSVTRATAHMGWSEQPGPTVRIPVVALTF
jgi:hypothetical protein